MPPEEDNGGKWTDHKTNEKVQEMVEEKRILVKTITERRKNCVGDLTCFKSALG